MEASQEESVGSPTIQLSKQKEKDHKLYPIKHLRNRDQAASFVSSTPWLLTPSCIYFHSAKFSF